MVITESFNEKFLLEYDDFVNWVEGLNSKDCKKFLLDSWNFFDKFIFLKTGFLTSSFALPKIFRKLLKCEAIGQIAVYKKLCFALKVDDLYGIVYDKEDEKEEVKSL